MVFCDFPNLKKSTVILRTFYRDFLTDMNNLLHYTVWTLTTQQSGSVVCSNGTVNYTSRARIS